MYSKCLILILLLAVTPGSSSVFADQKADKEKQLQALRNEINKLKRVIDVKEDSKSQYSAQLRKIENQIGAINQKIKASQKQIDQSKSTLNTLRRNRESHQVKLIQENEYLAQQIHAAFTLGKQEKIKLLLSQQDATVVQRNLVYYEYFSNARVNLIDEVEHSIEEILRTETEIGAEKKKLDARYSELKEQQDSLNADSKKRRDIISSLNFQIKQQGGQLSQLQSEAKQLQQLIDSIGEILDDMEAPELTHQAFHKLRGKLAWPVEGKVKRMFGRLKPVSDLRWQGVIIEAPTGRHVRAISHGRIAFADWLRGMGNLVIIDHGNAYLSLYGHNESLFKSAGDWVEPGDIIASVGSSGGRDKSALYFEIRKKGKPQNPTKWCKSSNRFASR